MRKKIKLPKIALSKPKKQAVKRIITSHWKAKLIAIIGASILWLVVAASQGIMGKLPGEIPIKPINVPDGYMAIYDQDTLEIEVLAAPSVWQQLSTSSFVAYMDLAGLGAGTHEIEVVVKSLVPNVQIINKKPSRILVSLEEVLSKNVSVNKRVEGAAAEGLVASNVDLVPSEVLVSGPKSVVSDMAEATAMITLSGEVDDFERTVEVVAYDQRGERLESVSFTPQFVIAQVTIAEASNNKTVGVKVSTEGAPGAGKFISKVAAVPNTIDITGPSNVLQSINYLETETIDVSGIEEDMEATVGLLLPAGVSLQKGESREINVVISVENGAISRIYTARVSFEGLAEDLLVSSYKPEEIKVTLMGGQEVINNIEAENIKIILDVSELGEGKHDLSLSVDDVSVPEGVVVDNLSSEDISIVLESK